MIFLRKLASSFLGALLLFVAPATALAAAPTVSSFSPTDGATTVALDANLVIVFSESVTPTSTISSFVTIKNSIDDSTFEAIDVSGGLVTGGGSDTITINPASNLIGRTSYYVQIDDDAFYNGTDEYYAGISDTTTWNFTAISTGGESTHRLVTPPEPVLIVDLDDNTVRVSGSYGGQNVVTNEVGFTYTSEDDETTVAFSSAPQSFNYVLRDLACGTEYTFVGYAMNNIDTTYSDETVIVTEDCEMETEEPTEAEEDEDVSDDTAAMTESTDEAANEISSLLNAFTSIVLQEASSDLSIGNTGLAVTYLQAFLLLQNTGPAAQALLQTGLTEYFGTLTQAALAEYQAAHGIAPAFGYWGSITRAYIQNSI